MSEITRNPLCWPGNVPRTLPQNRTHAQFAERSVDQAARELLAEINRLNQRRWDYKDESVIVSTNIRLRQDGLPLSNQAQPADTGAAVYFTLRFLKNGRWVERPCVLSCDKWNKVGYNLTAIAKDIEAQRARDRWGATTIEQAYRGYLALPASCGAVSWWVLLGLPSTASQETIKEAYRVKALSAHPDKGGDREAWDKLSAAYDEALTQFRPLSGTMR